MAETDWLIVASGIVGFLAGGLIGVFLGFRLSHSRSADDQRSIRSRVLSLLDTRNRGTPPPFESIEFPTTVMMPIAKAKVLKPITAKRMLDAPAMRNGPGADDAFGSVARQYRLSGRCKLKYPARDGKSAFHNVDLIACGKNGSVPLLLANCDRLGRQVFEIRRIQACVDLATNAIVTDLGSWLSAHRAPADAGSTRATRTAAAAAAAEATLAQ